MGIKGGIARKLLKLKYGTPEASSDKYDIDVLVFLEKYTPESRHAMREIVTGTCALCFSHSMFSSRNVP